MTERTNQLTIDGQRLWDTLMRSGEIGTVREIGLCRLALTDADKAMRDLFIDWCRDAGLAVTVDGVGNIFARRSGADDTLPPVMVGSHLDSQITGGKFDGILGVLAGLEIVRTFNEQGIDTKRPLEIVSWTNEEGTRFPPPMMGSGAFMTWIGCWHASTTKDRYSATRSAASATTAISWSAAGRSTATLGFISNKGRSWMPKTSMSASPSAPTRPTVWSWKSSARPPTLRQRPWTSAATPSMEQRC
jgi:hydantoinase/carbamoylase family amidase